MERHPITPCWKNRRSLNPACFTPLIQESEGRTKLYQTDSRGEEKTKKTNLNTIKRHSLRPTRALGVNASCAAVTAHKGAHYKWIERYISGLERKMCSLIKKYLKGLSPAMKQVILLFPLSHQSTPLVTLHPLLSGPVGGFNKLGGEKDVQICVHLCIHPSAISAVVASQCSACAVVLKCMYRFYFLAVFITYTTYWDMQLKLWLATKKCYLWNQSESGVIISQGLKRCHTTLLNSAS